MKLFTIHDSKAESYGQPMCFKTTAEAIRNFGSWCKDPESNLHKFATDYSLLEIGEYDESNGKITTHDLRIIANAAEFIQSSIPNHLPLNELEARN